jgi:chemotaxis protein methyltransferase CheR
LPRLRALRLGDFEAYYRYLLYTPGRKAEMARMLEAVTIRETYFFREPRQLEALRDELLPGVAGENSASRTLRIWSAGCASGEEPYSVAIVVLESGLFDGWSVEILGTDLVPEAVEAARRGLYRESSLRAVSGERRERYFTKEGANAWRLDERVRRMVAFDILNLADERAVASFPVFDLVLCRNVLIYFGEAARRRTVIAFYHRLREGGFLLLGHAETLAALDTGFTLCHLERDVVYQR